MNQYTISLMTIVLWTYFWLTYRKMLRSYLTPPKGKTLVAFFGFTVAYLTFLNQVFSVQLGRIHVSSLLFSLTSVLAIIFAFVTIIVMVNKAAREHPFWSRVRIIR